MEEDVYVVSGMINPLKNLSVLTRIRFVFFLPRFFFFILLCATRKEPSTDRQNFQKQSGVSSSSNGGHKNDLRFSYWRYFFLLAFCRYIFRNIQSCRNASPLQYNWITIYNNLRRRIWDDEYPKKLFVFLFSLSFSLRHSDVRLRGQSGDIKEGKSRRCNVWQRAREKAIKLLKKVRKILYKKKESFLWQIFFKNIYFLVPDLIEKHLERIIRFSEKESFAQKRI